MRIAYFDCPSGCGGRHDHGRARGRGRAARRAARELRDAAARRLDARACAQVRRGAFRATKVDVPVDRTAHHPTTGRSATSWTILDARPRSSPGVQGARPRIFTRLADAEARAHGRPARPSTSTTSGAVDAIVDITARLRRPPRCSASSRVHVLRAAARRRVRRRPARAHPVPGPGTAELLRGFPVVDTGVRGRAGDAHGRGHPHHARAAAGRMPSMTVTASATGQARMDPPGVPNVLRCFVGEATRDGGGTRPSSRSRPRSTTCRRSSTSR